MNFFGFNQDLGKFACVSTDNRIKIWDTLTDGVLQQFKQSTQFNAVYTCARWGPKRKQTSKAIVFSETLAMGTQVGTILFWDITKGEIVHTLGSSSDSATSSSSSSSLKTKKGAKTDAGGGVLMGAVTDVWFHPDGRSLFSTFKESSHVVQYDLSTGAELRRWKAYSSKSSKGVDAIRVTKDGNFAITASSNNCIIKIWDLSTLKSVSKFVGHSSSVSNLALSIDNRFLLSSAAHDRFLNLWRLNELEVSQTAHGKKGAKKEEKAPLVLDDDDDEQEEEEEEDEDDQNGDDDGNGNDHDVHGKRKSQRRTVEDDEEGESGKQPIKSYSSKTVSLFSSISPFHTNGSSYHVLSVTPTAVSVWEYETNGESLAKPVSEMRLSRSDRQSLVIWADFADENTIIIARGPHFKPHFEKLNYIIDSEFVRKQKITPLASKGFLEADKSSDKQKTGKATATADAHTDDVTVPSVQDATAVPRASREKKQSQSQSQSQKQRAPVKEEKTMEEALMEQHDEDEEDDEDDEERLEANDRKNALPKSDTVIAVLLQALRTGDEELLNSCVEVGDEKVIHGTVRLLPTRLVLKFLTLLIERFQLQPKEAPFLIPWIKAVLEVHTAFVMGLPNHKTSQVLSSLFHTVDSRISSFGKLLTLSGRLDLILSQVSSLERALYRPPSKASLNEIVVREEDIVEEEEEC